MNRQSQEAEKQPKITNTFSIKINLTFNIQLYIPKDKKKDFSQVQIKSLPNPK